MSATASSTAATPSPVFIACCARSGSTLLRYALDSHPQLAVPPELHLLRLCERLAWSLTHTGVRDPDPDPMNIYTPATCAAVRGQVQALMADFLTRSGKSHWAEKSISSVDHLGLLEAVFPDARVLFLYRSAPGVMASCDALPAADAAGFEFDRHLAEASGNRMDGLAAYWLEKTDRLLAYQQHIGPRGLALRYEDLLLQPELTLDSVMDFLDLPREPGLSERIFSQPHQAGPGDPNIHSTQAIDRQAYARGQHLPLTQLSARRRRQVNSFHQLLGYPRLDPLWQPSEKDFGAPISTR